jgi:hypothetical protein
VAVCLLPGTEVAFEKEVEREVTAFQLSFFKREPEHINHTVARFRQVNLDNPHTHHDALESRIYAQVNVQACCSCLRRRSREPM